MVNCRICKWCFKEITDDFVVTKDGDFLHNDCYLEIDEITREDTFDNGVIY